MSKDQQRVKNFRLHCNSNRINKIKRNLPNFVDPQDYKVKNQIKNKEELNRLIKIMYYCDSLIFEKIDPNWRNQEAQMLLLNTKEDNQCFS